MTRKNLSSSRKSPTPAVDHTNNPFHALEHNNCKDKVPSAPKWSPLPLPASVPRTPAPALRVNQFQQATPTQLVFKDTPSPKQPTRPPPPRVSLPPSDMPQCIPIAHWTRARLAPPPLSSFVELVQYHIPTAKTTGLPATKSDQFAGLCKALSLSTLEVIEFTGLCEKLTILDNGDALAVLDQETGKLLEHRQLCKDPHYKKVWDRSYSNELGRLCQGIGTGDKAGGKRVAGTNTFHIIVYVDIPYHKRKRNHLHEGGV
jgi:hypothetical protein